MVKLKIQRNLTRFWRLDDGDNCLRGLCAGRPLRWNHYRAGSEMSREAQLAIRLRSSKRSCRRRNPKGRKRFVVRADEKLTAFLELERAVGIHVLTEQV